MLIRSLIAIALFTASLLAQRIAVLEPQTEGVVTDVSTTIRAELATRFRVLDTDLAAAAFRTVDVADHFNLSADEARRIGTVIGCDAFVIVRSGTQRRAAIDRPAYFEAFAVTYLVDSRSGNLIYWHLDSFEADKETKAAELLQTSAPSIAAEIAKSITNPTVAPQPKFPEPPSDGSPQAAGLRLPIPYKRIKPEYTAAAFLYNVKATVDIEADVDTDGNIRATRMVRWAGYGLDQSVERAVRSMNWRPAMRDGKPLPMRVLLRYNFKKIEKDEEP